MKRTRVIDISPLGAITTAEQGALGGFSAVNVSRKFVTNIICIAGEEEQLSAEISYIKIFCILFHIVSIFR